MLLSHGTLGGAFRVLVLGVFASGASLTATLAIAVTVGSRRRVGARRLVDVYFFTARFDATAFLTVAVGVLSSGILSPTLAFFLGASGKIERIKVYLAFDVEPGHRGDIGSYEVFVFFGSLGGFRDFGSLFGLSGSLFLGFSGSGGALLGLSLGLGFGASFGLGFFSGLGGSGFGASLGLGLFLSLGFGGGALFCFGLSGGLGTCCGLFGGAAACSLGFGSLALQAVADAVVFVEFVVYDFDDVVLDSGIGARVYGYIFLVEELNDCIQSEVELFCQGAYFSFRHILLFVVLR